MRWQQNFALVPAKLSNLEANALQQIRRLGATGFHECTGAEIMLLFVGGRAP